LGLMDASIMTGEGWEVSTKTGQAYIALLPAAMSSLARSRSAPYTIT
jgi:uncharacterized protein YqjF (DUF2071 family)